jgi:hypothetical protein
MSKGDLYRWKDTYCKKTSEESLAWFKENGKEFDIYIGEITDAIPEDVLYRSNLINGYFQSLENKMHQCGHGKVSFENGKLRSAWIFTKPGVKKEDKKEVKEENTEPVLNNFGKGLKKKIFEKLESEMCDCCKDKIFYTKEKVKVKAPEKSGFEIFKESSLYEAGTWEEINMNDERFLEMFYQKLTEGFAYV